MVTRFPVPYKGEPEVQAHILVVYFRNDPREQEEGAKEYNGEGGKVNTVAYPCAGPHCGNEGSLRVERALEFPTSGTESDNTYPPAPVSHWSRLPFG